MASSQLVAIVCFAFATTDRPRSEAGFKILSVFKVHRRRCLDNDLRLLHQVTPFPPWSTIKKHIPIDVRPEYKKAIRSPLARSLSRVRMAVLRILVVVVFSLLKNVTVAVVSELPC